MEVCQIGIVDDHKIVRDGIQLMLKGHSIYRMIFGVDTIGQLFEQLASGQPDILILDLNLPGTNGLDIIETLKNRFPSLKILVLSAIINEQIITSAIEKGVDGYVSKDADAEELLCALDALRDGDEFFGNTVSNIIYQSYLKQSAMNGSGTSLNDRNGLSERELEVLRFFAEGYSYKKIADTLNISTRTVESHRVNIMMKLEFENLSQLIRFAIKNEIISL